MPGWRAMVLLVLVVSPVLGRADAGSGGTSEAELLEDVR